MLQLRWGPSTDIWSFGATVSYHRGYCKDEAQTPLGYKSHLGPQLAYVQARSKRCHI